jgi:hypothetical protein
MVMANAICVVPRTCYTNIFPEYVIKYKMNIVITCTLRHGRRKNHNNMSPDSENSHIITI